MRQPRSALAAQLHHLKIPWDISLDILWGHPRNIA